MLPQVSRATLFVQMILSFLNTFFSYWRDGTSNKSEEHSWSVKRINFDLSNRSRIYHVCIRHCLLQIPASEEAQRNPASKCKWDTFWNRFFSVLIYFWRNWTSENGYLLLPTKSLSWSIQATATRLSINFEAVTFTSGNKGIRNNLHSGHRPLSDCFCWRDQWEYRQC